MFKENDKVRVKRDIYRWSFVTGKGFEEQVLYCKENDRGIILEIFYPDNSGAMLPKIPHAKVLIDDIVRTLRLSSIEKVRDT